MYFLLTRFLPRTPKESRNSSTLEPGPNDCNPSWPADSPAARLSQHFSPLDSSLAQYDVEASAGGPSNVQRSACGHCHPHGKLLPFFLLTSTGLRRLAPLMSFLAS